MGSAFNVGFQQANDAMLQRRAEADAQKNQQRAQTAALYWNAVQTPLPPATVKDAQGNQITNPAYADAEQKREGLIKDYLGYLGPEQHATIGNRLHALIFGPEHQEMQQSAQAAAPPPAAAAAPPQSTHPMTSNPQYTKIQEGLDALSKRLKGFAHPLPPDAPNYALMAPPPAAPDQLAQKYAKYQEMAEGKSPEEQDRLAQLFGMASRKSVAVKNILSPDGKRTQAVDVNSPEAEELFSQGWKLSPTGSSRPIPGYSEALNIGTAKILQRDQDQHYLGKDGKEWNLASLPSDSVLVPVFQNGEEPYWTVATDKGRYETAGNLRLLEPAVGGPNPTALSIGTARVGSVGTHQVPGMAPGEKVTLGSTTTPITVGAAAHPTVSPTSASNSQALNDKLNKKKSQSKQVPISAKAPNADHGLSTQAISTIGAPPPAFAPGTMLTQGRSSLPMVERAGAVAANIFGTGDEKPIWNNAWMFDKPDIRAALNKALTMNALANPGTEDDPSVMQQLATTVGLTGASQEQINKAVVQSRDDLEAVGGPEASKMFARMAGMQEDLTALRAVTGGSSAASTIKTMVRAAPVYNVSSAADFRNRLGATLNTAASALRMDPFINPAYSQWWVNGAQAARGAPVSANAPKLNGAKAVHKVGDTVKLKNGQAVKIKHVYPDGSFD